VDTSTTPSWTPSAGPGVPPGGTTGQYLQKRSNTDYDTLWSGASRLIFYQTLTAPTAASSPYPVTHNLGTQYVQVQLWDAVTGLLVGAQVQVVNVNTIQIAVAQNMPNNVNVVVIGAANLAPPVNPPDIASKSYVDARTPNLPPSITSGSGVQSFTDVLGTVWVAANGVNGGAWKQARDVLYSKWFRSSALTMAAAGGLVPLDTSVRDQYALYLSANSGWTIPVSGLWQFTFSLGAVSTAAGQAYNCRLYQNSGVITVYTSQSGLAGNLSAISVLEQFCSVGDLVQTYAVSANALAVITGQVWTYGVAQYVGTG
jgi:hypothetical protein